ncbi:MAG TPA: TetR family transcriptional regulator [Steroidobacteraceae bacterium]|nr:TetR family transcriptional regulator [Steroidobacteraceae bacterium]
MAARKTGRPAKERLLDAAERLFAKRGYHGVSIRDITDAAKVDVALVHYHFGSKRAFLTSVFERRAEVINRERLDRLEAVSRTDGGTLDLEAVVNAFMEPLFQRSARGGRSWKSYFALVAQVNNSPELSVLMTRTFDPVVHKFIDVLQQALPGADPRDIYWAYHFLTGALTLTFAETGRLDKLSGGLCRSSDLDSVHARFAPFMATGFAALAARRVGGTEPRKARAGRKGPRPGSA